MDVPGEIDAPGDGSARVAGGWARTFASMSRSSSKVRSFQASIVQNACLNVVRNRPDVESWMSRSTLPWAGQYLPSRGAYDAGVCGTMQWMGGARVAHRACGRRGRTDFEETYLNFPSHTLYANIVG